MFINKWFTSRKTHVLTLVITSLILLFIVVGISIATLRSPKTYLVVTPTPTQVVTPISNVDTSTWKTYKDTQYGFEFKYPSDWSFRKCTFKCTFFPNILDLYSPIATKNISQCEQKYKKNEWSLHCGSVYAAISISMYRDHVVDISNSVDQDNHPGYENVQLGNLNWLQYRGRNIPATVDYHIDTPDKKSGFRFSTPTLLDSDNFNVTLREIISTFKFI